MKLKVSLDKEALKIYFLDHVEKIVFGVIVLCFGLIVYEAVGRETFEQEPQDLAMAATNAEAHWQKGHLPEEAVKHRPYPEIAQTNIQRIPFGPYTWTNVLHRGFEEKEQRGIPPLLNVRELVATGGRAALDVAARRMGGDRGAARSGPRGFRYVVVTGLIPKKEQEFLYEEYFVERVQYNPERDVPRYLWFAIERAEVQGTEEPAEADFAPLDLARALATAKLWGGRGARGASLVEQKYLHPRLTFPLPPRVSGTWGEEAAHGDQIPLPTPERVGAGMGEVPAAEPEVPDIPGTSAIPGIPGGVDIPRLPGEEEPTQVQGRVMEEMREPDHLLFRFFDFTVEPGKKYRYRVRLWLVNPNYGMDVRYLIPTPDGETPLNARRYLEAKDWSEPSNVAEVPDDSELMLLGVKAAPPNRVADEPSASLGIVQWVNDVGKTVYEDFEGIRRGGVLDFTNYQFPGGKVEEEPEVRPRRNRNAARRGSGEAGLMGEELYGEMTPESPMPSLRGRSSDAVPVDYRTGAIVLDIRGGERISQRRSDRRPGALLLLGADGSLRIHHELDDAEAYEQRKAELGERPEGREGAFPGMEPGMELSPGGGFEGLEGGPGFQWEE